jgi:hypothetical protein
MSTQTPQTDDLILDLQASRRAEIRHIGEIAKLLQERDRLKALCDELRGALRGIYGEIAGIDAEDRTKAESSAGATITQLPAAKLSRK